MVLILNQVLPFYGRFLHLLSMIFLFLRWVISFAVHFFFKMLCHVLHLVMPSEQGSSGNKSPLAGSWASTYFQNSPLLRQNYPTLRIHLFILHMNVVKKRRKVVSIQKALHLQVGNMFHSRQDNDTFRKMRSASAESKVSRTLTAASYKAQTQISCSTVISNLQMW